MLGKTYPARGLTLAAACGLSLCLLAPTAQAELAPGWYAGTLGGLNFNHDTDGTVLYFDDAFLYNTGHSVGVFAGYRFGAIRLQADVLYRHNGISDFSTFTQASAANGSSVTTIAPMVSALYDLETGTALTPYLGFGLGAAQVKASLSGSTTRSWTPAYQGIAGVNYDLGPDWALGLEYRYFETLAASGLGIQGVAGLQGDFGTRSQSLFMDVTYRFGDTLPALPPILPGLGADGSWYVGTLGGLNINRPGNGSIDGVANDTQHYNTGYATGAFAGYDLGKLRLQADLIYRRNGTTRLSIEEGDSVPLGDSSLSTLAPMFSALYDFDTGSAFTPYVGAGVGAARVTHRITDLGGTSTASVSTSKWTMAYQGLAGINYDVAPNWKIGVEYRFFATPGVSKLRLTATPLLLFDLRQDGLETQSHSTFLSLTYSFGTPALW